MAMKSHTSVLVAVGLGSLLLACSRGPSKAQALETIQAGVKEEASCILPVETLKLVKMQHATKGICVPKEGAEKARACIDALVAAGVTHAMPESYMRAWPDEVATASLSDIPAYERRPRSLVFGTCVELVGELREGRFTCGEARADKVAKITATDDTHAEVRYDREITLRPAVATIDAACGAVTKPPGDATVALVKGSSGWILASAADATDAGGAGGSR
jgi:hypothetical protein